MSRRSRGRGAQVLALALILGAALVAPAAAATPKRGTGVPIDSTVCVDRDDQPISMPKVRDPNLAENLYREGLMDQLSTAFDIPDKILWALQPLGVTTNRRAANVNRYDEVPASTWFTPRNHVRALKPEVIRNGPEGPVHPQPPYTIKNVKKSGVTPGFQIKDGADRRWVVKLDPKGYPQLGSGAAVVSGRLIWAAGYNFPQDEAFSFTRDELKIDDVVDGLMDFNEQLEAMDDEDALEELDEEEADSGAIVGPRPATTHAIHLVHEVQVGEFPHTPRLRADRDAAHVGAEVPSFTLVETEDSQAAVCG
jgi:hypothetical protein